MPKYRIVSYSQIEKRPKRERRGEMDSELQILFLVRESLPSLYKYGQSGRRQFSGQEGELLYAERASRGYHI